MVKLQVIVNGGRAIAKRVLAGNGLTGRVIKGGKSTPKGVYPSDQLTREIIN